MIIYANGSIWLDGADTGIMVTQKKRGTVVYCPAFERRDYVEYAMPHPVYSLAAETPASGVPGRGDFERDVRTLLATLESLNTASGIRGGRNA